MSDKQKRDAWDKTSNQTKTKDGDVCAMSPEGAWICWSNYGDYESTYGWDVDHWKGSSNDASNLRAMQRENNRSKGDSTTTYIRKVHGLTDSITNKHKDTKMRLTNNPKHDEGV